MTVSGALRRPERRPNSGDGCEACDRMAVGLELEVG